jgi:dehydrogenase/reductase SDR family protein 13
MSAADLAGRTFFVTGTTSGIGRPTVEALVARGASVVVGNRNQERTNAQLEALRQRFPRADVSAIRLDLSELASVKRAAEEFLASGRTLDVLVNNAGVAAGQGMTKDGFELTIGTNHLGPFLLTKLLLPRLRAAPQGRIVNVASEAHRRIDRIDFDRWREPSRGGRHRLVLYAVSKMMNVLHAKELARRLVDTPATTYSLHPGVVATDIWRHGPALLVRAAKLFMISEEDGAKTSLYCATAPELSRESGRYYEKSKERAPGKLADDAAVAKQLWERSEQAIAPYV